MAEGFVPVLNGSASHRPAFFRTAPAGFGASLTVIDFVLRALASARIADLHANAADFADELRPAAHERRRRPADCRAILVEPDALGHLGDIALARQASAQCSHSWAQRTQAAMHDWCC